MRTLIAAAIIPFSLIAADDVFVREVQPILAQRCYGCHAGTRSMGGVRFDQKSNAFSKAASGSTPILPGKPEASEVVQRVRAADPRKRMPLGQAALSDAEIATLEKWIRAGAAWPEGASAAAKPPHWAFQALSRPTPPAVRTTSWVRNPIDAFILAALEKKGLAPSKPASQQVLIRRLAYDLTGLPPAYDDVDRFAKDASPTAEQQLIEKLLASQNFGERWARHWLDLARYADSEGYEYDKDRPSIYRYRDFVIQAINEDMPFDRFVRWQLAGDEYEPENERALIATGFLTAGSRVRIQASDSKENKERMLHDELDDIVSTTSVAMLGLTAGCARCHDHKFDPIPTRDYYRMDAVFRNIDREEKPLSPAHWVYDRWLQQKKSQLREQKMAALPISEDDRELLRFPLNPNNSGQKAAYRDWDDKLKTTDAEFQEWLGEAGRAELAKLKQGVAEAEAPLGHAPAKGLFFVDSGAAPLPSFLLARGDVTKKLEPVEFGFLTALLKDKTPEDYRKQVARPGVDTTFRRAAFAEWMVDPQHGAGALLARVAVNRLWYHHFGQGLVRTPDDFGTQGEAPTHPELLDWLAGELIRSNWSLKHIHRLIVSSATYQQAADHDARKADADPDNRLLWTRRPVRLEAEILRDAILTASGSLNLKMFGPAVRPFIPREAMATRTQDPWPKDVVDGPESWRRSVYLFGKRSIRQPMMETFDTPDPNASCGRRLTTTLPTQALALMNDAFVRNQAMRFADRVVELAGPDSEARVRSAYRLSLSRDPSTSEMEAGRKFLSSGTDPKESLVDLCHLLFTLNEFAYVD
jgi:hypothetical protein